jgi:hypothetical protein
VSLFDLPKGHQFPPTSLRLTPDDLARYLAAVEDANPIYLQRALAPPLAVAAAALGLLLESMELPAGTVHTGQELEMNGGVPIGAELTMTGSIAQRSERAGMAIVVIEFSVTVEGAATPALRGRSTVLAPVGGGT